MKIQDHTDRFFRRNNRSILALGSVILLILCSCVIVHAQVTTASVRGAVTDEQGNAVADAVVTITNTDTGYSRSDQTDKDGNYGFQSLPIGRYTLSVVKDGFRTFQEKDIVLHVNDSLTLNAQLKLGARTERPELR